MDLIVKDVAELLNVSETMVHNWLAEGQIPAYKINDQYRFSRIEIENWVLNKKKETQFQAVSYKDSEINPLKSDQRSQNNCYHVGRKQFSLYRAIHKGKVLCDVPGKTKEEVIRTAMSRCAADLNLDADVITELLLEREKLMPTALNNGIAVPHTRECLLTPGQNVVLVVFPKNPIPYGALDGEPVHSLFFLFASEDKRHLHLLAKIAHLSSEPKSIGLLRIRPSKAQLLDYIRDWEAGIQKSDSLASVPGDNQRFGVSF